MSAHYQNMDELDFKLERAEKFLSKIPKIVPKRKKELERLEENSEAFLFFSTSAIEIIKRKINERFKIFDSQNVYYIHGLRKNLLNSGSQRAIKDTITKYFSTPEINHNKNIAKSELWILQTLRNQAMHGKIIKPSKSFLEFSFTIHNGKRNQVFSQRTRNPNRFFKKTFQNLEKFIDQIISILEKS